VAIHTSSAREIDALIADLSARSGVARDSAVARLTVIGSRAAERLVRVADDREGGTTARVAALRVLEGLGDARALEPALRAAVDADADVAAAGIAVIRKFVPGSRGVAAVDGLAAIALSQAANEAVRLEAIEALGDLDATTVQPLWQMLARDSNPRIRSRAVNAKQAQSHKPMDQSAEERLASIAELGLPDVPELLRRLLTTDGAALSPSRLHRIVERIREREGAEAPGRRAEWTRARGCAHVALAKRSSLLGIYDLREALESAPRPLPLEFLAALTLVGDASCLEAIAVAHGRAADRWWREHLADTFVAIVRRHHLTGRHTAMKKIQKRWPAILTTRQRIPAPR
jgi:HEAT repeat protein